MFTIIRRGSVGLTIAFLPIVASGCAASRTQTVAPARQAPAVVVAQIGASEITQADLSHWSATVSSHPALARERVLGFLIRASWLMGEAHELAVSVPASEVKHQVTELVADEAENYPYGPLPRDPLLKRLLLTAGLRSADREWLMSLTLLLPRVQRARLARARRDVPRARIEQYYARHRRRFFLSDQRQLEIIGGSEPAVLQAKHEIEGGKPFLEVAQVSQLPEAPGGLWRLIRGHDEPQVEGPVFAAKPHVLVGPKQYSQYYIFDVLEVIPAHQQTLAEVEGKIREELAPTPERVAWESEQTWVAHTICAAHYVLPECREHRSVGRSRTAHGAAP